MNFPSIFETNLRALETSCPLLAARLAAVFKPAKSGMSETFRIFDSFSGKPAASFFYDSEEILFVSKHDPEKEAEKMAATLYVSGRELFVLIGFGLGYLPRALLRRLQPSQKIFVLEPDWDWFCLQAQKINFQDVFDGKKVFLACDPQNRPSCLLDTFRIFLWQYSMRDCLFFSSPSYRRIFEETVFKLEAELRQEQQVILKNKQLFQEQTIAIKQKFFEEGLMKDAGKFFRKMDEAATGGITNETESAYLLYKEALSFKSYEEERVI